MPKQTTDVSGNPFAIQYTAINQKWTINKGVDVLGTVGGVYSTFAGSKLVNSGDVSGGTFGAYFSVGGAAGDYSLVNKASGELSGMFGFYIIDFLGSLVVDNDGDIDGTQFGLYAGSAVGNVSVDISNGGDIQGSQFGVYVQASTDVDVTNTGEISGGQFALFIAAGSAGAAGTVVDNSGKIESAQYGVYVSGPAGITAKLVNDEGALIKGGVAAVLGLSQLDLKNLGKIEGDLVASSYDDKIINKKTIKGDLLLGVGVDTFKQKGDKAKAGLIDSQDGNDLIVLGTKVDKLLFDSTLSAATNVDTVKKFASGKDAIYLDEDIFSAITPGTLSTAAFHEGTSAADADDRIIYDKASGALYYDPDGLGGVAQTQFAKLDGGPKLKASDFTIGEYSIVI